MARRREQVLDAAVEVLGGEGARGLTYQAVDRAAAVPTGTTSNYFRNRAALLGGIVEHLLALERREWEAFAQGPAQGGTGKLVETLAALARRAAGPGRARTAARFALLLESAARPELRAPLARARQDALERSTEWVRRLGSAAPERHGRILLDHLEGLVLRQLAFPGEAFDPADELRALVGGLLGGVPAAADGRGGD
ncbi:TetR family transcriptional regulator [Streptomyces sp. NRRL F-4489]|uniref:TetR/AcrR family transcriptional regulator n=1 Tax=Streptomyces sp. NRRL F-4489 TaxID=1609095 RepID=UPI000747E244|nr:TetR/AcrR family transcriptional regulator [Streptomyces sp. NRRL F-4489]KUL35358.1 TetR family transcriptional regulator [Streptomyces sp. NRRL F-4489]